MSLKFLCTFFVLTCLLGGKANAEVKEQPEKIGTCPVPEGAGICVELCTSDFDCDGNQKCCSNGCGHVCTAPQLSRRDMRRINKRTCPRPFGNGTCNQLCENNKDCECDQKCCFNGCGNECMDVIWDYDCDHTYKCGGKRGRDCPPGFMCKLPYKGVNVRGICCIDKPQHPDCSNVLCPKPDCPNAFTPEGKCCPECPVCDFPCPEPACSNPVFPPGECCPQCEPDCSAVICPLPKCQNPSKPVGECCPVCPDCSAVVCPLIKCRYSYLPPGECCPICIPDCSAVLCLKPDCPNSYVPEGQCCPICPDCSLVACPAIFCENSFYPPGECCPQCIPDCSKVICPPIACPNPFTPVHECCAICPDCSNVACPLIFCENPVYPPGACCPLCPPDCSKVFCPKPPCSNSYIPDGECCAVCPDCSLVLCQPISCEMIYIPPGECCAQCIPGCCSRNGRKYKAGDRFQEDCNICICHDDGSISCTKRACVTCTYKGKTYQAGESFPDDCNTCYCSENGLVICTLKYCPPCQYKNVTYDSGTRFAVKCNTCTCSSGAVGCTEKACFGLCANGQKPLPKAICGGKKDLKCRKKGYQCDFSNVVGEVEDPLGVCCKVQRCPNGLKALSYTYCNDDLVCPKGYTCEDSKDVKGPSKICCLDCTDVKCPRPPCRGCYTVDHQCCPICPGYCLFNGKYYKAGKTFDVDCNACTCGKNGNVICTDAYCPPCEYEGVVYESGTSFQVKCNKCKCSSGKISCTKKSCEGLCANGEKPLPDEICGGIAGLECKTEGYECDYSNVPKTGADYFGICCKALVCPNKLKPLPYTLCGKGLVCPNRYTCESSGEGMKSNRICCLDCSTVRCAQPDCKNPYVPVGQCCAICPGTCTYDGVEYQPGESFYIECNKCTCTNGQTVCTLKGCFPGCYREGIRYVDGEEVETDDPCIECTCHEVEQDVFKILCRSVGCPPAGQCFYKGEIYEPGETFADDCNTCFCAEDGSGSVGCTEQFCPPCTYEGVVYDSGTSFRIQCNTCSCSSGSIKCTRRACDQYCRNGLKPLPDEECGGIAGLECETEGYQCELPEGGTDLFGICCREEVCSYGLKPLNFTHCNKNLVCPQRYICEPSEGAKDLYGICCLDCRTVKCGRLECEDTFVPEGECCPVCRKPCVEDGIIYQSGETFYRECNTCKCKNGLAGCTRIACRPGCYRNGSRYDEGDSVLSNNPCEKHCKCFLDGSEYKIGCDIEVSCEKPCVEDGIIYQSGESFFRECNTCQCRDGQARCTKIGCPPGCYRNGTHYDKGDEVPSNDLCEKNCKCYSQGGRFEIACEVSSCQRPCIEDGIVYQSGESFYIECNRCFCSNGLAGCTKKGCFAGCYRNGIRYDKGDNVTSNSQCEKNCKCYLEGNEYKIGCDIFGCKEPCVEDGIMYPSGETFYRECNTCTCRDGEASCTKIYCAPGCYRKGFRYDKGESVPSNPCEKNCKCFLEQREFVIKCEVDTCDEPCVEDGIIYQSGESFKRECNTCICENGLASCTKIACPPGCYRNGTQYDEGDDVEGNSLCEKNCKCYLDGKKYKIGCDIDSCKEPCIANGIVYQSGESFFQECNGCTCSNGLARCTKIACRAGCYRNRTRYDEGDEVQSNTLCEKNCKCFLEYGEYKIGCDIVSCEDPCVEDGIIYQSGETFYRECNTCNCKNGLAGCTRIGCSAGCYRNRTRYNEGDGVPSISPCEKNCKCFFDGIEYKIGCDMDKCKAPCNVSGTLYPSGTSFWDECNRCACEDGLARCTLAACAPGCYRNGIRYDKGDSIESDDPCEKNCTCYLVNREYKIQCDLVKCPAITCKNPRIVEGECCPVCDAPCNVSGKLYPSGTSFWDKCNRCTCGNGVAACTLAFCPPGCYRDGNRYEIGQDVKSENPCEVGCFCTETGEIICAIVDCLFPTPCPNPIYLEDQCCPICPPGCLGADGKFYNVGDEIPTPRFPCEFCECTGPNEVACSVVDCAAPPCTNPIQKPDTCCPICEIVCFDENGNGYFAGQEIPDDDPCQTCFCQEDGDRICASIACALPFPCEPFTPPGECCPICKDVEGCSKDGELYSEGEEVPDEDPCKTCRCINSHIICISKICPPLPCDNAVFRVGECCPVCPLDGCTDEVTGEFYPIGAIVPSDDSCTSCFCNKSCLIDCMKVECEEPLCENPMSIPEKCCPYCETGSCEFKGRTINAGEELKIGCCTCKCMFGEAQCGCIKCPPCPTGSENPPLPPPPECCGCP